MHEMNLKKSMIGNIQHQYIPGVQQIGSYQLVHLTIKLIIYNYNNIVHIQHLHTHSQVIPTKLISMYELSSWYAVLKIYFTIWEGIDGDKHNRGTVMRGTDRSHISWLYGCNVPNLITATKYKDEGVFFIFILLMIYYRYYK